MNQLRKLIFTIFLFLNFSLAVSAQIEIVFPATRAVFQRDNQNNGYIPVTGITSKEVTRVEGRLVPMVEGQGTETGWQLVDDKLTAGTFTGRIAGTGGWYKLQIRTYVNESLNSIATLERVGIGEVFVVSGQSNAQGFLRFNPKGAKDDRVNGYGFYKSDFLEENPTLTDIRHIDRELDIGPHGQSAWAWGEFGDKIASKFNVPVLIFNTAYEGTLIENWVKSANGESTVHQGYGFTFPGGTPYSFLRIVLQNHASMYGMRSIIWIQGESDYQTNGDIYYANLKYFINKVGADIGKTINWFVTKTSLNFSMSFDQILFAQQKVINELSNVHAGPLTDYVGIPRIDGVHLFNNGFLDGISELATALDNSFNQSLLNQMPPMQPSDFVTVSAVCTASGNARISLSGSYPSIKWNNNTTSSVVEVSTGTAKATLRDSKGNYLFTESIRVSNLFPEAPQISSDLGTVFCEGKTATITTNRTDFTIEWQDGSNSQTFSVSKTASVFAKYRNNSGCVSPISNTINLKVVPTPATPVITSQTGSFGECEGSTIVLAANTGANKAVWSNGRESNTVSINSVGKQSFTVKAVTPEGCESALSEEIETEIYSRPLPPVIEQEGPYSLGIANSQVYESYVWKLEGSVLEGEVSKNILAPQDGYYSVLGFERHAAPFGAICLSKDSGLFFYQRAEDAQGLSVYPNPIENNRVFLSSDTVIEGASISMIDNVGRRIIRNQRVGDISTPYELSFPDGIYQGTYYLIINYNGLERRFRLFFK
ncbi:MAG: sialate O-acetylesterase [Cytophagales bacterium]|nr:sialate O-acetylesterase [Cytophagales bacterium]